MDRALVASPRVTLVTASATTRWLSIFFGYGGDSIHDLSFQFGEVGADGARKCVRPLASAVDRHTVVCLRTVASLSPVCALYCRCVSSAANTVNSTPSIRIVAKLSQSYADHSGWVRSS